VSKGPETSQVPSVTGRQQAEAVSLLQEAGFLVTIMSQDVTDPSQDGLVLAENPHGGQKAKHGASVTITVGHLVQQPTTTAETPPPPAPTTTAPVTTAPATTAPAPPVTTTPAVTTTAAAPVTTTAAPPVTTTAAPPEPTTTSTP
jgi:beta-lactam-binding protein with PASTA domain